MADYAIDFAKVDAAFQQLADTNEGNQALEKLQQAIQGIGKQAQLNEHEVHYLITNLVQQRQGGFGPNIKEASATRGARVKSGFLIKTAVP